MTQRILVVDDEEPILFALSEFFAARGYTVDSARELEEAQALLVNVSYGIVIADLRLTGIHGTEGLELVTWVRERSPRTKIILLTAYGSPAIEQEAIRRGVHHFLHKPQPLAHIHGLVQSFIGLPSAGQSGMSHAV